MIVSENLFLSLKVKIVLSKARFNFFLIDNHYKTLYSPVSSEYSSCGVWNDFFTGEKQLHVNILFKVRFKNFTYIFIYLTLVPNNSFYILKYWNLDVPAIFQRQDKQL